MKYAHTLFSAALVFGAGFVLTGCGITDRLSNRIAEKAVQTATGGKVQINKSDDSYSLTTDEGTLNVGSRDISGLTKVVTLPAWIGGGESSGVMTSESNGKLSVYASVVSERSVEETYNYFVTYFTEQGYGNITKSDYMGTKMINGSIAGDTETNLAVTVNGEDDGVMVVIVYSGPAQE